LPASLRSTLFIGVREGDSTSGHLAWATFKYSIAADFRERYIEGDGMGTAVLQLGPNGRQIMHWHTSSARRPAAAGAEKKN